MENQYKEIVEKYIHTQSEKDLYAGQKFSRRFIENEIPPEEVIGMHKLALKELLPDAPIEVWHSFDFLIEMMIHYGLALQEHQSLVKKQEELEVEMKIAAQVQKTLLNTKVPEFSKLDIGFLTIPAKTMNGDYIYFLSDDENNASVAVADVMGKGIPAALCMSMIKFGMDSLQNEQANPSVVLDVINRIVEDSVTDSMFISMCYGNYNTVSSVFSYASAGHEPALLFKAAEDRFVELDAKGLLLGVQSTAEYEERSVVLENGDFIVMLTDGVTEMRTADGFIDTHLIKEILFSVKEEPAQEIADTVFNQLASSQQFPLRDDFTIVVFKRDDDWI